MSRRFCLRASGDRKGRLDTVVWRPDAQFLASERPTRVKTTPPARFDKFFIPKPINKSPKLVLGRFTSGEKIWSEFWSFWKSVNGDFVRDSSSTSRHE
ncbi:hypothetical protein AAC387_Pa07g1285 [Persea americana]